MTGMQDEDALATLAWLVEAGADEATVETPVNRLVAKPPAPVTPMPATPRPAPAKHGVPGRRSDRRCLGGRGCRQQPGRTQGGDGGLRGLGPETRRHQHRLRGWHAGWRRAVHRRSAGPRRRPDRQTFRGPRRAIAGQDAGEHPAWTAAAIATSPTSSTGGRRTIAILRPRKPQSACLFSAAISSW